MLRFDQLNPVWRVSQSEQGPRILEFLGGSLGNVPVHWVRDGGKFIVTDLPGGFELDADTLPLASRRFFVAVYLDANGRWGFPLQMLCDVALLRDDEVMAPAVLRGTTQTVWVNHPRADRKSTFEALDFVQFP